MNIRTVTAAFAAILDGLEVTEPRRVRVAQIYSFLPPSPDAINLPCVMQQYRPLSEARGPNEQRTRRYAVRLQLFIIELPSAESDVWSEVAASFDDELISRLDEHVKLGLGEGVTYQRFFDFGQTEYQPGLLEWNGHAYLGTQYEYEVQIHDTHPMAL